MRDCFEFDDMESGWRELLSTALFYGTPRAPRKELTLELEAVKFTLTDPSRAVVTSPIRKLNHAFSAAEFCWVMAGDDEVDALAFFNSKMRAFADQPPRLGRQSPRLYGAYGPPLVSQLPYVIENLKLTDSRQAVATIWRPSPPPTRDVPCTVALQFLLRDGRLSMLTFMRSNDLWLGTPYDVPLFCRVLSYVAGELGVPVGKYHHVAGSLHLYGRDFDAARAAIAGALPVGRSELLVVRPFEPHMDPAWLWGVTSDSIMREPSLHSLRGAAANLEAIPEWRKLADLMLGYATRKRERGGVE